MKSVSLLCLVLTVTEAVKYHKSKLQYAQKRSLTEKGHGIRCVEYEFMCASGECIPSDWACDTQADCEDGSDEMECQCICTGENKFQCKNRKCIPHAFVCDTQNDCGDHTDEVYCHLHTCRPGQVQCDNYKCIEESWLCDGENDCHNGWDETDCAGSTCEEDHFRCANGIECIPPALECDGVSDCSDSSDEQHCECNPTTHFQCINGGCLLLKWRCDNNDDCGDFSDELGCPTLHPNICNDRMTLRGCLLMNETSLPICHDEDLGFKYCRKFCNLCLEN